MSVSVSEPEIRPVRDTDWPALLELANESVEHVPGAGSQEAWHHNRRHFDRTTGVQRQYVAVHRQSGTLLGYVAVESNVDREFRLFLVVAPRHLSHIGELLYERGIDLLRGSGADRVWFTEYSADEPLLSFARAHGFREFRRLVLPEGAVAVTLVKEAVAQQDEMRRPAS